MWLLPVQTLPEAEGGHLSLLPPPGNTVAWKHLAICLPSGELAVVAGWAPAVEQSTKSNGRPTSLPLQLPRDQVASHWSEGTKDLTEDLLKSCLEPLGTLRALQTNAAGGLLQASH